MVEFGNAGTVSGSSASGAISPEINDRVHALYRQLLRGPIRGIIETVPAYSSLMVCYDPVALRFGPLARKLAKRAARLKTGEPARCRVFHIPVCYGGPFGEDMEDVAAHAGLSIDEVIRRHCAAEYRIYMLGFLPGFAYLGGLDPAIAVPRLEIPRTKIPAGAVGIGGSQTGIYPLDSPGGWRLIGRTPVRPYDAGRNPPVLYRAGDRIRFIPIDEAAYRDIARQVEAGIYRVAEEGT
jgi:KipI family sensor histidine kinase inhibitor